VFEYILREAGCKAIRVEEVYSIDKGVGGEYRYVVFDTLNPWSLTNFHQAVLRTDFPYGI
jgi:hypothetical protein